MKDKYEHNKSLNDLLLKDNKTVKLKKCNISENADFDRVLSEKTMPTVK